MTDKSYIDKGEKEQLVLRCPDKKCNALLTRVNDIKKERLDIKLTLEEFRK